MPGLLTVILPLSASIFSRIFSTLAHPSLLRSLKAGLCPAPDALVHSRRVSRAVSNARNEGPQLIDEIPDERAGLGL